MAIAYKSKALTETRHRTRKQWAKVISADWRKSIESIIQTGRDLIAAKAEMPNGQFGKMVKNDLDFGWSTANKLMRIAAHPALSNSSVRTNLPTSWTVLNELTQLSKEDIQWAQERGLIDKKTSQSGAQAIAKALDPKRDKKLPIEQPGTLPPPSEAKKIAAETGAVLLASDNKYYTPSTDEETDDHVRRRTQTYRIRDSIRHIADCPATPANWIEEAEDWWFSEFEIGAIDAAIEWLTELKPVITDHLKVLEHAK